jgi:hypothetical protein
LEQDAPCFALAMIEERQRPCAALVLNPGVALPAVVSADGFEFGHSMLGGADYEVLHFAFEFRRFETYNVLLNPSNALVQAALRSMVERGGYFIVALAPARQATVFRADFSRNDLLGLREHYQRLLRSTTSETRYRKADAQFRRRPQPPGLVLNWVCRDDEKYLEPASDPLEMARSAQRAQVPPDGGDASSSAQGESEPTWQPLSMLPAIGLIINGELGSNEALLGMLRSARERPHVLDNHTIERAIRLCTDQMEFVPIYREQLARWRDAAPATQQPEIERLQRRLDRHAQVLDELLALARELRGGTIDAILSMSDMELALAMLSGRIKTPR